jgi:hypothetical protein
MLVVDFRPGDPIDVAALHRHFDIDRAVGTHDDLRPRKIDLMRLRQPAALRAEYRGEQKGAGGPSEAVAKARRHGPTPVTRASFPR